MTRSLAPVATLAVALLLTSCAAPLGRTGTPIDPVTLTSTWGNGPGGVGSDVLDALVQPSDSAIAISAPGTEVGRDSDDEEGGAVAELAAGAADISVIRADRLVAAGAASLAPLQAPLVVTNEEQAAKIAADPVLSAATMADLRDIGLMGLALAPGGLRHPFGYVTPLLGPADYVGATINTRVGPGVNALIEALGASTDHSVGQERADAASSGTLRGIEVSLLQSQAVDRPAVLTANVTLYEKFDVVVIRSAAFDSLSAPQQAELVRVSQAAIETALDRRQTEAEAFASWCDSGSASAVLADGAALSAIKAALQPVLDHVMTASSSSIDRMRALHDGTSDFTPVDCVPSAPSGADGTYQVTPSGDQTVLDGVWRLEISEAELTAAGVNFHDAQVNAGVWTLTIKNGIAVVDQPRGEDCAWQFSFDGDSVSLNQSYKGNAHCGGQGRGTFRIDGTTANFDWTAQRDYDLVLDTAMFQHGLVKVG